MIKFDGSVKFEIDNKVFDFSNREDYKEFIMILTNPILKFSVDDLLIDEEVTDVRELSICEHYQDFFRKFLVEIDRIQEDLEKEVDEILSTDIS